MTSFQNLLLFFCICTYILVAYQIILCPDTQYTADIAGTVLITAVMSLDSVPVLPFSSGNTVVAISSHIDTVYDCHNSIADRKSMFDGGTNCGKGGPIVTAIHGPGGPLVVPCLVRPDHLRCGPPAA